MRKGKLLLDFLEELKTYKDGVLLNNTITIYCGDYSKRELITTAKLKDINTQEYQSYRAIFYDQSVHIPNYIEIYVRKIKNSKQKVFCG